MMQIIFSFLLLQKRTKEPWLKTAKTHFHLVRAVCIFPVSATGLSNMMKHVDADRR